MKKLRNLHYGYIVLACVLCVTDLVVKIFIIKNFETGEIIPKLNGWIAIGRIETLRMPFGFNGGPGFFGYLVIAVQVVFVIFFIRIQSREVDKFFKLATVFIVFGWIGNYLDRLFFAKGNWAYVNLDYFNLALAGNSVINLSSLMILIGWFLLIVVALLKFSEFKSLFRKNTSLSSAK